jgi:histidyl-tRNA synthetase
MQFQIPKGTFDILPYGTDEAWRQSALWQYVEAIIRKTTADYGYSEIRTPIYERSELFDRGVGETSDIVSKEMFTFQDKGGRSISLRPEGTSSVMRSFVENHMANFGPVHKLFYLGPMFRYERPQSGRYRQHHQFGAEAIGVGAPEQDAEAIDLLLQVYRRLGIRGLKVHLNTVGDPESRIAFRTALMEFLRPHLPNLSSDSQIRFEKNPLRILDSKDPKDREILERAPSILDYLSDAAKEHFEQLCRILDNLGIVYQIDPKIVRGLDYYNKTVFEVISENLGAQSTIGAGGRYDGLIGSFDGPDLPGVGFATGLERVMQVMAAQGAKMPKSEHPCIYLVPLGIEARVTCLQLATKCRHNGIPAGIELSSQKIQTALQNAARLEATYCAVIGSDEMAKGAMQLKTMATREAREVRFEELLTFLQRELAHAHPV